MKYISNDCLLRGSLILFWMMWGYAELVATTGEVTNSLTLIIEPTFTPTFSYDFDDGFITRVAGATICLLLVTGFFYPIASIIGCMLTLLIYVEVLFQLLIASGLPALNDFTTAWILFSVE